MDEGFTKEEKDLIDRLYRTGMSKNVAKTLLFILRKEETKSREIESETGLRQPEVSVAVNDLMEKDWISKDEVKKEGKGRPVHHYTLNKSFDKIISEVEEKEKKKVDEIEKNVEEIKDLKEKLE